MSTTLRKETNISNDVHLPPEVWYRVCSFLPKSDLVSLRLVCSMLGSIALAECYKTIYMEIHRESSPRRLCEIAKSCKLRHQVRELVLYDNADYYWGFRSDYSRQSFLNTLPFVRFFSRLTSLRVRFRTYPPDFHNRDNDLAIQHRHAMLDTIFFWIAGMGNTDTREMIDFDAGSHGDKIQEDPDGRMSISDFADFSQPAIPLQQLIVTNLPSHHGVRFKISEAFLKIISMASLRDLRLHAEARRDSIHPLDAPEVSSPYSPGTYKFFDSLHVSWLAPEIANNLRILTLHCQDFWGWCPRMDLRRFEFPQLKALSLGRYVFSHQWQTDWFASIGKRNGSEGLEELYLHDCPILYEATQIGPFDTFDPGYPLTESVLGDMQDHETHKYPIRWHNILSQWMRLLNKLKVFHMAQRTYQKSPQDMFTKHKYVEEISLRHRIWYDLLEELGSPYPSGPVTHSSLEHASSLKRQLTGIKFDQHRDVRMKYIKYDIQREPDNAHWPWDHPEDSYEGLAPEEGTVMRDNAAYGMLMDAVNSRAVLGGSV
ncbi:hypothetical protein FVEN_g3815 [Fusarium venenatum]|uniref:F-box domain-containing protein n=2 Tax=Fusarium venenatum TaxID=56646 RepID=A0A2L2THR8_9HYPO|nr:uncharacterized protein FVRRES_13793 [Fusarium venenatum]KAG8358418.1 hypothetical protein FVEN_g3815 [Fusarium venenatum]CEI41894.1 unnamed protein product [Fusarium venenatum]